MNRKQKVVDLMTQDFQGYWNKFYGWMVYYDSLERDNQHLTLKFDGKIITWERHSRYLIRWQDGARTHIIHLKTTTAYWQGIINGASDNGDRLYKLDLDERITKRLEESQKENMKQLAAQYNIGQPSEGIADLFRQLEIDYQDWDQYGITPSNHLRFWDSDDDLAEYRWYTHCIERWEDGHRTNTFEVAIPAAEWQEMALDLQEEGKSLLHIEGA